MKNITFQKSIFMLVITLLFTPILQAQVFTGNLSLATQAEVDAFNYTEVTGNLQIVNSYGNTISNLSALSSLTSVGGTVVIGSADLTNIDGLSNLNFVGGHLFKISGGIQNVNGLSGLTTMDGMLMFADCTSLTDITGLSNLTYVGSLWLANLPVLASLDGLQNLTSVGNAQGRSILLAGLPLLTNVNQLSGITDIPARLDVSGCANLNDLYGFRNITTANWIDFRYNEALTNVEYLSGFTSIHRISFLDNPLLTNIDGLSNVVSATFISFKNNNSLTNLNGLSNIASPNISITLIDNPSLNDISVFSGFSGSASQIYIEGNNGFTDLDDFSNFTGAGNFVIRNTGFTNLDSFANNTFIINLYIEDNDNLTNLDVFSGLTNLNRISVKNNPLINSLSMLCTAMNNKQAGYWVDNNNYFVSDNASNPTSADVLNNGNCVTNLPPIAVCQAVEVSADANCKGTAVATAFNNGSSDPDGDVITFSVSPVGPYAVGETEVTLTVTDPSGETSTCVTTVTVNDITPPTLTCAIDVSINNTPGECFGTTTLTPPTVTDNCSSTGNALNFGGASDIITLGDLGSVNNWTIETWFKANGSNNYENLFHSDDQAGNTGIRMELSSNWGLGQLYVYGTSGGHTIIPHGQDITGWHHVAVVGDKTNSKFYIYFDGVLKVNINTTNFLNSFPDFVIGRGFSDGVERDFNGSMDEFRIWNTARTQTEIQNNINSQLSTDTGLIAAYHFNEGVANGDNSGLSTVIDASGNGNDGTLNNFALNGTTSNWVEGQAVGPTLTNNAPATFVIGETTVIWTATDASNNTATCKQIVTVTDDEAPTWSSAPTSLDINVYCGQFTELSDAQSLAPAATDNCTDSVNIIITKTDGLFVPDGTGGAGSYTNTWTAKDASGKASVIFTQVITVLGVSIDASASSNPVAVGTTAVLSATVTPNVADVSVSFYLNDELNGTSLTDVSGIAKLNVSGLATDLYQVKAEAGTGCADAIAYLPVYDPNGGFVTGGGWIYSESGYLVGSSAEGKANFGFVAKYKTGKNNDLSLDGNTNFQFKEGDFHFKSSMYHEMSLVISGERKATYRGTGTVNGFGAYDFMVTVIDGEAPGAGPNDYDSFRIKVWVKGSPSNVVYDNEYSLAENADASTGLGGGSIVIHKPKGKNTKSTSGKAITFDEVFDGLELVSWPNPSNDSFTIKLRSKNTVDKISIQVFDVNGRLVSSKVGDANRDYRIGTSLQAGLYLVNVVQSNTSKQIKLIKH